MWLSSAADIPTCSPDLSLGCFLFSLDKPCWGARGLPLPHALPVLPSGSMSKWLSQAWCSTSLLAAVLSLLYSVTHCRTESCLFLSAGLLTCCQEALHFEISQAFQAANPRRPPQLQRELSLDVSPSHKTTPVASFPPDPTLIHEQIPRSVPEHFPSGHCLCSLLGQLPAHPTMWLSATLWHMWPCHHGGGPRQQGSTGFLCLHSSST